jgi:aryl-alcohol dehydrogenase-like predicted oxidoreductase
MSSLRPIADFLVSPVAFGAWPIAGMTSGGVPEEEALATIESCFEVGVNFFDTAYAYGAAGESERLIARAIGARRDQAVIATKGGLHWGADGKQVRDGRPARLRQELEESLARLATDRVELLYLHAPDPTIAIEESAGELRRLMEEGKARAIGVSNVTLDELKRFHAVCPVAALQPPYNMLERQIEADLLPWCRERGVAVCVYWPLMKGLLTGKFSRDHRFPPGDGRLKYPAFQPGEWEKNHDLLEDLRSLAEELGCTVTQLVVAWTIAQPGIAAALCGAKRPDQIADSAGAMQVVLTPEHHARLTAALARRGPVRTRSAV